MSNSGVNFLSVVRNYQNGEKVYISSLLMGKKTPIQKIDEYMNVRQMLLDSDPDLVSEEIPIICRKQILQKLYEIFEDADIYFEGDGRYYYPIDERPGPEQEAYVVVTQKNSCSFIPVLGKLSYLDIRCGCVIKRKYCKGYRFHFIFKLDKGACTLIRTVKEKLIRIEGKYSVKHTPDDILDSQEDPPYFYIDLFSSQLPS